MSNLDTLYRAFADFRKSTSDDRDCTLQRNLVARADSNNDFVETVKYTCHIEEDWVVAIEEGMEHVEKAIAEARQFIRNNGEVVPIEKVKRVSHDSVEHLARHSDLITKAPPEGEPVIPDQLYTVERLSDYAVYENRFLYMLLKYLEQFISLRYNKIVELANTYRGKLQIDKKLKTGGQNVRFKVELNEERRNDPLLSELNPNKSLIERIGTLYKMVTHYLGTPLMIEVAKSPMIRPPITVTNVLKMNHNFRGAMRLYEFVSSYDKPGYSADKEVKKISPFPDIPADEYAEVEALASFLTYQYGMGVKDVLREHYIAEEERRKQEAEQKHREKLAVLRRRIEESGESPEEYMLMLEGRNRVLEADSAQLTVARAEIEKQKAEIKRLEELSTELKALSEERAKEIDNLNQKYEQDMETARAEHEQAIADMQLEHEQAIADIQAEHLQEIVDIQTAHEENLREVEQQHLEHIEELEKEHNDKLVNIEEALGEEISAREAIILQKDRDMDKQRADHAADIKRVQDECDNKIAEQQKLVDEKERQVADVVAENKLLSELKTLSDARLTALKYKHGYMTPADDYTSELAFNEIEQQYNIFTDFFKKTWRKTKKKIRQDLANKLLASKPTEKQADKAKEQPEQAKNTPSQESDKAQPASNEKPAQTKAQPQSESEIKAATHVAENAGESEKAQHKTENNDIKKADDDE